MFCNQMKPVWNNEDNIWSFDVFDVGGNGNCLPPQIKARKDFCVYLENVPKLAFTGILHKTLTI